MSKTRKFGPISIRPFKKDGEYTGEWTVDVSENLTSDSKRIRRNYPSETAAKNIARDLAKGLKYREFGFAKKAPRSNLNLYRGIELWAMAQEVRVLKGNLQASSLVTRKNQLLPVKAFFEDCDLSSVTADQIDSYQIYRLNKKCKEVTINGETSALKQVLKWLSDKGHLGKVPSFENLAVPEKDYDIPEKEEVVKIIQHLPVQYRTLVRLMAETGLRPEEAYNLPWKHVNLEQDYISIRPFRNWQPKRKSTHRDVWLSLSLRDEMQRLSRNGTFVFSGRDPEKPITTFKKALKTAMKEAKLERHGQPLQITPKTFRKAFATWQAEEGVAPSILQKQMGHVPGSRMTEQHYIRVRDRVLKEATCELPMNVDAKKVAISGN